MGRFYLPIFLCHIIWICGIFFVYLFNKTIIKMKDYKAYLKREALNRLTNLKITSPIIISETELDVLVDGAEIERISDCGNPYKIKYKDLEMITTLD
jgi:hypothetical protein